MAFAPAAPSYPPHLYDPFAPPPLSSSPAIPPPASVSDPLPYYSHPYHHHHAVPPAAAATNPEQQNIHTLFVSGLPDDVKAREIHNLFRRRHGFDSCQLKYTGRGNQVVAFATFFTHQAAMAAMSVLNGVVFDPQTGATLHIELARSNSRKRPRGGAAYAIIDKRAKVTNDDQDSSSDDGDGGSDEPSGTENDNSSNKRDLAAIQSGKAASSQASRKKEQLEKPSSGDIPPCSTLFIANLGPGCTEEELEKALSRFPGFHLLKMRGKGGMPVAFADFVDAESSTNAMNELQGTSLASSDRGGMHLEYARSKMRKG